MILELSEQLDVSHLAAFRSPLQTQSYRPLTRTRQGHFVKSALDLDR